MIYIAGNISDEEYTAETRKIRTEIDKAKQAEAESRPADLDGIKKLLSSNFLSSYDQLNKEDQRRLWRSLIEEIYVEGTTVTGIKPRL